MGPYGGGGRLFASVRFALFGFDANAEAQMRPELIRRGGADAGGYGPSHGCTHIIVEEKILYDDPVCVGARKTGAKVVTRLWMDDSILNGIKAENADRILYRPVKDTSGISGFETLHICCIGFSTKEIQDIAKFVKIAGAEFHSH